MSPRSDEWPEAPAFPHQYVSKQLDTKTTADPAPTGRPRSIANTGDKCFIIAVLQLLASSPSLSEFMKQVSKRDNQPPEGDVSHAPKPILSWIHELLNEGKTADPAQIAPIIRLIDESNPRLAHGQCDAQELLGTLLGLANKDELTHAVSMLAADDPLREKLERLRKNEEANAGTPRFGKDHNWSEFGLENTTTLSQLTNLLTRKLRWCTAEDGVPVHKSSLVDAPTPVWSLEVDPVEDGEGKSPTSLDRLMRHHLADETCKLRCGMDGCTEAGRVNRRTIMMEPLPRSLIIHLKRFKYVRGGGCSKIRREVQVGLTEHVFGHPSTTFKLCGATCHLDHDGVHGGHYVTYALRQDDSTDREQWYKTSDQTVTPVSEEHALQEVSRTAYLLMFEQQPADPTDPAQRS
jgi:ubiquitin C-terminal hydrolase